MELVGYHGTDAVGCAQILAERRFIHSKGKNQWLGDGVYFFENDRRQAYMFSKYKLKKVHIKTHEEIHVLQAFISCDLNNFVDLATTEGQRLVAQFKEKFESKFHRRIGDTAVLNLLYWDSPYDLVRAIFPIPRHEDENGEKRSHRWYEKVQIQLCVKNDDCILPKSIKEVCCDDFA